MENQVTSIPPVPGAVHITRTVLHPYGRAQSPSYTLSLYDTGLSAPTGGRYWAYRLYEHVKGQKSTVLFQGSDYVPQAGTGEAILDLVNRLTTRPGDTVAETGVQYTPAQLQFLVTHAGPAAPVRARCADGAR